MITTIDFNTIRSCCIQIHQETYELFKVAGYIGETIDIPVKSADELRTNKNTKSWDGMGRYAKELYDNKEIWYKMPEHLTIKIMGQPKNWNKEEARKELLNCYEQLGEKSLYQN